MRFRSSRTALLLLLLGACRSESNEPAARSDESVAVAAASDLQFALDDVAAEFRKSNPGFALEASYGSSGNFFAQISQGAPFDLFLSADVSYPDRLIEKGLGVKESRFVYAVGRLVVWSPNETGIDPALLRERVFSDARVHKIAIANPEHAPYGKAAVAALEKLGVHDAVRERLVLGENVAQAAQFTESRSAELGIFGLGFALSPRLRGKGKYWELPLHAYPRMDQGGVVLAKAHHADGARAFRAFLKSSAGAAVLKRHGFFLPET